MQSELMETLLNYFEAEAKEVILEQIQKEYSHCSFLELYLVIVLV